MITTLFILLGLLACWVAYRAGRNTGYDEGYESGIRHRSDPVIPPGKSLPFGMSHARQSSLKTGN